LRAAALLGERVRLLGFGRTTPGRPRWRASATRAVVVALFGALLAVAHAPGATATAPRTLASGFVDDVAISGLDTPTAIRFAPNGQVFVAEKGGVIKLFQSIDSPAPTIVADLSSEVYSWVDHGLLGLAVDPQYPTNPYIYVLYSLDAPIGGTPPVYGDVCPTTSTGCLAGARLSRLTIDGSGHMVAEDVLIEDWCQTANTHSIGDLHFGADGYLYASAGDGANFGDYGQIGNNPCGDPDTPTGVAPQPPGAQGGALRAEDLWTPNDPTTLDGGVIRIDPTTGAAAPGNPFESTGYDENAQRLITEGLRNPFRFTIRPGTNELWIGNVGSSGPGAIEALERQIDPHHFTNFGWPCYEGGAPQPTYQAIGLQTCTDMYATPGATTAPYFSYRHDQNVVPGDGCAPGTSAISALSFTQGLSWPSRYDGALVFGDYARGCIWVMLAGTDGMPDPTQVELLESGVGGPVDLQVGPDGALYYAAIGAGEIHRITYVSGNVPPTVVLTTNTDNGPLPLTVQLDASGSTDPDTPGPLTITWDLDGDGNCNDATGPTASETFTVAGTYQLRACVTDADGATATKTILIYAGNSRPVPVITAPDESLKWTANQTIDFAGSATDAEDGPLPASALRWDILLDHCDAFTCHQHFVATFEGVDHDSFQALDHEYPSHLEIRLTATDSQGLTGTTVVTIQPDTVTLEVDTNPSGLFVTNQAASGPSPLVQTVIKGATIPIGVDSPQALGGVSYEFGSWDDGGAQGHTVNIWSDTVVTATMQVSTPVVSIGPATATEGPHAMLTFPVTLSGPSALATSVAAHTVNGTAIAGTDYVKTNHLVQFAPGETSTTFRVPIIDNSIQQPDRTLSVQLGKTDGLTVGTASASGLIIDDETPNLSVANAPPVLEGASGTTTFARFPITLDKPSSVPVTVKLTPTSGSAVAGVDFAKAGVTVKIPVGSTSATARVSVIGDALYETDETFSLVVNSVSGARVAQASGVGTIQNDDPPPGISVDDGVETTANGLTTLAFRVHLSAKSGLSTYVTATASDGTAVNGVDYTARSQTMTILAGKTIAYFKVKVRRKGTGRTIMVDLSNVIGATPDDTHAVGVC
jgi:glucose/arabinose dehydrogenase